MTVNEGLRPARPTLSEHMRVRFKGVLDPLARVLLGLGLMPNTITLTGLVGNAIGAMFLARGNFLVGGLLVLLMGPIDALDGAMARLRGEASDFGAFVDSVTDRYSELFIYGGLLVTFVATQQTALIVLTFFAAAGSVLVSYVKARAESLAFEAQGRPAHALRALSDLSPGPGADRFRRDPGGLDRHRPDRRPGQRYGAAANPGRAAAGPPPQRLAARPARPSSGEAVMIDAYGIHLGPLYFRFYGILLMLGALAAVYLIRWMMRRDGRDPDLAWDAFMWALVFGIIGARLWHVFTPSESPAGDGDRHDVLPDPSARHRLHLARRAGHAGGDRRRGPRAVHLHPPAQDLVAGRCWTIAAPGVALAQAIGRWGNFVNQELYGPPTDLPWGIFIRPENRLAGYEAFESFHPLFLYESLVESGAGRLPAVGSGAAHRARFLARVTSSCSIWSGILLAASCWSSSAWTMSRLRDQLQPAVMLVTAIVWASAIFVRHRRRGRRRQAYEVASRTPGLTAARARLKPRRSLSACRPVRPPTLPSGSA